AGISRCIRHLEIPFHYLKHRDVCGRARFERARLIRKTKHLCSVRGAAFKHLLEWHAEVQKLRQRGGQIEYRTRDVELMKVARNGPGGDSLLKCRLHHPPRDAAATVPNVEVNSVGDSAA